MTPYRERREKGHYNADDEPPDSTHAHHLSGLLTAAKPPPQTTAASGKAKVKITKNTSKGV
jgi:hypothetical protein